MRLRDLTELLLLSVLWGAAYLFMRAAVPAFGPAPMIALRMAIAAAVLLPLLVWRGNLAALWSHPKPLLVQAVVFTALPFLMLGFAAQHLTAGMMAVLNATAPLFAALLAHVNKTEPMGRWRTLGLVIGFAGVGLLTAGSASFKTAGGLTAVGLMLLASMMWAVGANYTRKHLAGMDTVALTAGGLALSALAVAPLAWATYPSTPPSPQAWAEVVFLGVGSSALGFLMYYRLLRRIGSVGAISVTFLNPVVALVAASLYLGEAITLQIVLGGVVVLVGTALGLRLWPRPAKLVVLPP
jgi:drug/metabolite transporter (DMT)-like permease